MNAPTKLWPYQPTTSVDDAAAWADAQPVRYRELHRVTMCEIEPHNLNAAQRQAADERAQHVAYMARMHGTGEVAEPDDPPMTPAAALVLCCVMALSAVLSIGVMALAFGAFR